MMIRPCPQKTFGDKKKWKIPCEPHVVYPNPLKAFRKCQKDKNLAAVLWWL